MAESEQGENQNEFSQRPTSSPTRSSFELPRPTSSHNSPRKKRKLRSAVWNDMEKVTIDGKDWAVCKICDDRLSAGSRNGTRHLHDHLARCKEQLTDSGKEILHPSVFDQETSRHDLASMIILHEYPLSIVDHVGFRKYSNGLQPMFKMVSRNTIKSDILKIYGIEKEKTMNLLEKIASRIAITTDMWTAKPTKRGFMAITAHFIDETWLLHSRILRFVYVRAPHNEEALSNIFVDAMFEWNIESKLSAITVDNASTNDAMMSNLKEKLPTRSFLLGDNVIHMRCCAHILNLIVKEGLKVIDERIQRIRDSCYYWTATQGRKERFEEVARQMRIPETKSLAVDVKTRWNSTYFMLQTALAYKDVFSRLRQRERSYTYLPSEDDWFFAKEVNVKLKVFNIITELFSGTTYPTANTYFPKICEIKVSLLEWLQSPIQIIRVMASKMLEKYEKYWNECHVIMGIACVLDPRFKMKLVEYYYSTIYGDGARLEIEKVRQNCYDLLHEYQSRWRVDQTSDIGVSSSSYSVGINDDDPLSKFDLFVNMTSSSAPIKSELDFYLEEKVVPRTPEFDVLSWWKINGSKFPTLKKIARDILAIPVSTVASESSFSTSGRVVTPHRSRLHATTLEALMCAQSWLWSESKGVASNSRLPPKFCEEECEPEDLFDQQPIGA